MAPPRKYLNKLHGARVLVIGGSSGIGFGVAEGVLECGASKIVVSSSSESRIQAAITRLKNSCPSSEAEISGHVCNLADEATLESNIQTLFSKTGDLDHIVVSAGDNLAVKPLDDFDLASIKQAGMVRFFAPLLVAKYGSKTLARSTTSTITFTTGGVADHPAPNWTVVAAYMSGVHGMMRNLAHDLRPIRVNAFNPGGVKTEMWDRMPPEARATAMHELGRKCTTGTIAKVEDVVEAYLYFLRDRNVTGTVVESNGGYYLTGDIEPWKA